MSLKNTKYPLDHPGNRRPTLHIRRCDAQPINKAIGDLLPPEGGNIEISARWLDARPGPINPIIDDMITHAARIHAMIHYRPCNEQGWAEIGLVNRYDNEPPPACIPDEPWIATVPAFINPSTGGRTWPAQAVLKAVTEILTATDGLRERAEERMLNGIRQVCEHAIRHLGPDATVTE